MNKMFIAACVAVLFFACDAAKKGNADGFTIHAEISGVEDSTLVYLQLVRENALETIDSAAIESSEVDFSGKLDSPEMVYLNIGNTRKIINIFGENSDISIKVSVDSLDKAEVTGSKTHDDLLAFMDFMKSMDEQSKKLNEEYQLASREQDHGKMQDLATQYEQMRQEQIKMIGQFVNEKKDSFVAPFIIKRYLAYEMEYPALDSLLSGLSPEIQASEDYQTLNDRVMTLKRVEVGQQAVDFALSDTTGNPISISSFRGKVLLIDFWASWCGPCRQENPNVVKLYKDYQGKGFEIIGVSFDESRTKWIDAIHQDQLTWPHVSDLKGWASEAGKLYAINAIPATVLLDREGKIIAKNLRGDALRKKLEEYYAEEDQNS